MGVRERLLAFVIDMSMVLLDMDLDRCTLERMTNDELESLASHLDSIYWNN